MSSDSGAEPRPELSREALPRTEAEAFRSTKVLETFSPRKQVPNDSGQLFVRRQAQDMTTTLLLPVSATKFNFWAGVPSRTSTDEKLS